MTSLSNPPKGSTHSAEFYGDIMYYKESPYSHLNQVSEEWQTLTRWYVWKEDKGWVCPGDGFSTRRLEKL